MRLVGHAAWRGEKGIQSYGEELEGKTPLRLYDTGVQGKIILKRDIPIVLNIS
jgi:hypothetical protein